MAICAVFNEDTDELVNFIVAEVTDEPPAGCYLVFVPENTYWNGEAFVEYPPEAPPSTEDDEVI